MRLLLLASAAMLAAAQRPMPASTSSPPGSFDLQGHRGARGLAPENTLAAFARALGLGVTTLEMDLGVTRDGVVVVSHDPRLNPDITRGPGGEWLEGPGPAISSLSFDELRRYDVGRTRPGGAYARRFPDQVPSDGERIPKLEEVFELAARAGNAAVRFNVETKIDPLHPERTRPPEAFAEAVIDVVRASGMAARTTVQSFDWRTLRHVQSAAPEIATVCLTVQQPGDDNVQLGKAGASPWLAGLDADDFGGSLPRLVKAAGAAAWSPDARGLSPAAVKEAHALGLLVIPWTVNEPAEMKALIALGVDGLISDRPDVLRRVAAEQGLALPAPTPVKP